MVVHKQVFRGSLEAHSSFTFNSSIRDVTKKGPLGDAVFRFAFARRSLYPLFNMRTCVCKCGALMDPTGSHILFCRESGLFNSIHTAILDAIVGWMQAYIRKFSPSPFRIIMERGDNGDFHRCWVRHYYNVLPERPKLGNRADALLFHESDALRPFVLDVVSVMRAPTTLGGREDCSESASSLGPMLDAAHAKKIATYSKNHAIPIAKIIPIVVGRSDAIHPSTLSFFDFFIANAHSPPLTQAPTCDRLSLLHAVMYALHDRIAFTYKLKYDDEVARCRHLLYPLMDVSTQPQNCAVPRSE
jgi:hypothetical protein